MKHPRNWTALVVAITAMAFAQPADSGAAPDTMPIDDSLFVGSGHDVRRIVVERLMPASPDEVWAAWTTEDGWKAAYGPDRPELRANIELAPGGRYEWLFDGRIGSNDCQVLSYLPPRMLSFSWNAPVTQPLSRAYRTWVVVEIEPVDQDHSLVRTTQLGFGEGKHWDETLAYFEQGWAHVLEQMASNFREASG